MHIAAVTVCVNYSDFLVHFLEQNLCHFDELVVVTTNEDKATQEVCRKWSVRWVASHEFNYKGDAFNKGAAINVGVAHLRRQEWVLHIDCDIILPGRFRDMLSRAPLDPASIHGIDRFNCTGWHDWIKHRDKREAQFRYYFLVCPPAQPPMQLGSRLLHNDWGWVPIGYFQLWHNSTNLRYPLNQGSAEHTDVLFAAQWHRSKRVLLPEMFCIHLESEASPMGANWNGRKSRPFGPGKDMGKCPPTGHGAPYLQQ